MLLHGLRRWLNIDPSSGKCLLGLLRPGGGGGAPVPPPPLGILRVVIFEASEYGPIEIRLFTFKVLGLNMLKYAN